MPSKAAPDASSGSTTEYADRFFGADVADIDPRVETLIQLEAERQSRRIILIPSESYAPLPVRQALGSVFTNVYAEGYPPRQMMGNDEDLLADLAQQLITYRRYADRRFYKGADYVHLIETLAQRRAAACFANQRAAADEIHVNVQPLSGAVANLAVYDALLELGDTLMGMDLFQGGHLTHGSEFNVSGKRYNVVSYEVARDGTLDYDQIRALAEATRPKLIIAGYTSYPWAPDFSRFREIADAVGAYLMADIAHPAGMVVAGQYPNPVGIADVVTFTTHKTLCGPRGACILTTHADLARRIDAAVFPGLQGGPHTNKFAAMCVAFEIARSDAFCDLQRRIVENAQALAAGLVRRDLELAYGGTNTHLLLVDLKSAGRGARAGKNGKETLYGEVVARILELAGVVVNKQTIPGDTVTALATGIRLGTPWVTQRGMGPDEMDRLADCIARIVHGIVPFTYEGVSRELPRGKIDPDVLEEVKWAIDKLACQAKVETEHGGSSYPHYCIYPQQVEPSTPLFAAGRAADVAQPSRRAGIVPAPPVKGALLIDLSDLGILHVSGWRALPLLDDACTVDVARLSPGQGAQSMILGRDGSVLDDVTIWRLERDSLGRDRYLVLANPENTDRLVSWLRSLSDGYVLFDDQDVWRKVRGPAKVELLSDPAHSAAAGPEEQVVAISVLGSEAQNALQRALGAGGNLVPALPQDERRLERMAFGPGALWVMSEGYAYGDAQYTVIGTVADIGAVWGALVKLGVEPIPSPAARYALRERVGLPGAWPSRMLPHEAWAHEAVGHPAADRECPVADRECPVEVGIASSPAAGSRNAELYLHRLPHLFDLHKTYFVGQSRLPCPDVPVTKSAFEWSPSVGQPQRTGVRRTPVRRTPLYEEHLALGAKMIEFAGWEMPVWYSSVGEEHQAVRERTGLFDVGHMGTIEVSGPHAVQFLDLVSVNYAWWLQDGESQYAGLLDANGKILDDIIVYRRAWDRYLVVVNAANFDKDWAWLNAVNRNEVIIDRERPWVDVPRSVGMHLATLIDLKDPSSGSHRRMDIALQGPMSRMILLSCADDPMLRKELAGLERTRFVEGELGGIESLVSRTGYTGEAVGYELYVHPDQAGALWRLLLERGRDHGIQPCGLAARDSTRIEAGLPLYGHELAGPLDISPSEAGFGAYVRYHKPFFVGRMPYKAYNDQSERRIARIQVSERGARALRGGEPVVNKRGKVIGQVTSCALVGDRQIGMALVEARYAEPETELYIYPETRRAVDKAPPSFELGDTVALPVHAEVITRFPAKAAPDASSGYATKA